MRKADTRRPIRVIRETAGVGVLGWWRPGRLITSRHRATRMRSTKAMKSGIAIVAANNNFYNGLLS